MDFVGIPSLLLIGSSLAFQTAANVQLERALASTLGASTVQLAVGASTLVIVAALAGSLGALDVLGDAEPWTLLGGIGSAIYIAAAILLFPRLGAVVASGLIIAGQMLASLVLDGFGWLGLEQTPVGPGRWTGAVAVLAGAWLMVRSTEETRTREPRRQAGGWVALALLAGAVLPVQGAMNARLDVSLHEPTAVGAYSSLTAAAGMALTLGIVVAAGGAPRPRVLALGRVPWWGWLGGICGASYVTAVFLLIPEIGAAPVMALTVGGQQLASVFVDRYGLFRLPRRGIPPRRLLGVVLVLAGVALITVA